MDDIFDTALREVCREADPGWLPSGGGASERSVQDFLAKAREQAAAEEDAPHAGLLTRLGRWAWR